MRRETNYLNLIIGLLGTNYWMFIFEQYPPKCYNPKIYHFIGNESSVSCSYDCNPFMYGT